MRIQNFKGFLNESKTEEYMKSISEINGVSNLKMASDVEIEFDHDNTHYQGTVEDDGTLTLYAKGEETVVFDPEEVEEILTTE